jgi:hypothetical protein
MFNHNFTRQFIMALVIELALGGGLFVSLAQKRGERPKQGNTVEPKRGEAIIETEERPGSGSKTIVKEVKVKPSEGTLILWAVPGATITLVPLRNNREGAPRNYDLKEGNKLTLPALRPGEYRLQIIHPDYLPSTETIKVVRGEPTALLPPLISRYGSLIIGGAPLGASILLDGQSIKTANLAVDEQGRITLTRVPVGEHQVKLSKSGYDPWLKKVTIRPGEPTPETAELKLATITLTLKAPPRARVYLNGIEKAAVPDGGRLAIPGLAPGEYQLDVSLDNYESHAEVLALSLADRDMARTITMVPIATSGEATADFETGLRQWNPQLAGWRIESGARRGLHISGDEVALFRDATERRPANVYFDFNLVMSVRFPNDKGAAWVIRAKDAKNYYLFELATPRGERRSSRLDFYVCRDGVLELKNGYPVPIKFGQPDDTYYLTIEARGNKFKVSLGEGDPIGNFTDDTFSYGGVGFRAVNGIEMLVQQFVVMPNK